MKKKLALIASILTITLCAAPARAQWTTVGLSQQNVLALAVSGANLFAGTGDSGVFRSTNNGITWTQASAGLYRFVDSAGRTHTHVGALAVSGTNLFAGASDSGIYRSTNDGTSWTVESTSPSNVDAFAVIGTNLFAGTGASVYRSTDSGTSWTAASTGLTGVSGIYALAVIGTNLFAGTGSGVYGSIDSGTSWTAMWNGMAVIGGIYALAVSGTNLFAGGIHSNVYRSTDSGASWTAASTGLPGYDVDALLASGANLFAGTYAGGANCGVYLSTNNGISWTVANFGLPAYPGISAFAVSGPYLFAGTWLGVCRWPLIPLAANDTQAVRFFSTGTTTDSLAGDSSITLSHRIDFVNASNTTLTITNAALTASNYRFSIQQILPGVPDTVPPGGTFSMIVDFTGDSSGTIYLDTIVLTIDPNELVTSYYVYLKGNSYSSAPSGVSQNSPSISADLRIYPNPFSQSTQISFTSQDDGYADVSVVNMLGEEVARIFEGELGAGEHSFTWDAISLPQGMYESVVRQGEQMQRISVVRLR